MDGDAGRLDSLERRMQQLEGRVSGLEAHRVSGLEAHRVSGLEPDAQAERPAAVPPVVADAYGIAIPAPVIPAAVTPPTPPSPWPAWAAPAPAAPALRAEPPAKRALRAQPPKPAWGTPAAAQPRAAGRPAAAASAPAPVAVQPALAAPEAKPALSLKDLEERFAGRALAWIGGAALIAAAVFFLSLAFSRGWITPPMRVLIGLAVGSVAFAGGSALLARRNPAVGSVLAGVGLGILSIALMAATRLYGLIPPEIGLVLALAMAVAAAVVAIRFDARSVAALGLVAALAAPPLTGASASTLTLLFVAVTLVGTTAVALYRSWRWLPSLAFLLAAPQLAVWLLGDPVSVQAIIALTGFWIVNIVATAGEEVRIRRDDLRPATSILVLANASFLLWGLFVTLDGSLEVWRGLAVLLAAVAHLVAGAWFLARQGWQHLFGNLVAGTGVALVAIATFVQLGAPAVPIAWAAEATALAWLAARRVHRWSALGALALGTLVLVHLLVFEYPLWLFGLPSPDPFVPALAHPEAASLAGVLAALGVAIAVVPVRWIRSALVATALVLAAYAAAFEVSGPLFALVLAGATIGGLVADRLLERVRTPQRLAVVESWVTVPAASIGALVTGMMAVLLLFVAEFPVPTFVEPTTTAAPGAFISLGIVLAALVGASALVAIRWVRSVLAAAGVLLVTWAAPFGVEGTALVAVLAVLLPLGVVLDAGLARLPVDRRHRRLAAVTDFAQSASVGGVVPWLVAAGYTAVTWPLDMAAPLPAVPFTDPRSLAVALLAATAIASTRWLGDGWPARVGWLVVLVVVAWLVPSEVAATGVVILWVLLAGAALLLQARDRLDVPVFASAALLLWAGALAIGIVIVAPPYHLYVSDDPVALPDLWMAAFAMLAAGCVAATRVPVARPVRGPFLAGAGVIVLYAVSVAVVDLFARRVGGGVPVEELAKQAQVALSVCWTAIGVVLLGLGLVRNLALLRHAGFALLAAATTKVVLIDMASLDVAYRAVVLFGLGLLLLAGAWLLSRFRGPHAGAPDSSGQPHPA